jgi:hypothetical protein
MLEPNIFIMGGAFILGGPVPLLGNAVIATRKSNNGFLKIDGSSHNFLHCDHILVLTVGAIVYTTVYII